jgi:serine/threonine-protein phosphatase 2A regulatory subunit A
MASGRHDDVNHRINATKHLGRIAKALGPERTREELIPFMHDSTDDDDDVLLAMAGALGTDACRLSCLGASSDTFP